MKRLYNNGIQNGAKVEIIEKDRLRKIEPYVKGVAALFASEGASFDSTLYVLSLAKNASAKGAKILLCERVCNLIEENSYIKIITNKHILKAKLAINCAGLYADYLAKKAGLSKNYQIIPFKGEYYQIVPSKSYLVNSHIYPVPDPEFPFLGVHLSRTIDGRVLIGPTASLSFAREGYDKLSVNLPELLQMILYKGFWNMLSSKKFLTLLKKEWKKTLFKSAVLKEIKDLIPQIHLKDLIPSQCGIRAQLVAKDGVLVNDFIIEETPHSIHILNATSPALTCSLSFAEYITQIVAKKCNI